jgi:hypothetical protein
MRKYFVRGGNTYSKERTCPNWRQHTDIKMSCLGAVVCTSIKMKWPELLKTRVNRPLRYCYILAPESVLHIPVDYYLSVHNSGKYIFATPPLIIYTYIHTYTRYTFFLNSSLFMMALSFLLSISKLFALADIKGCTS